MGIKDFLGEVLSRGGDILSRPSYAVGNFNEALAHQVWRPWKDAETEQLSADIIGDTNPLTALLGGLAGKDKVGPGDSLARMSRAVEEQGGMPGWLADAVDNPVSRFGLNVAGDPTIAAGSLGQSGKVGGALAGLGQGDDAGRFAKIAGKLITPERVQNYNLAGKFSAGDNALKIPAASLIGASRRIPAVDNLINRLYEGRRLGSAVDDIAEEGAQYTGSLLPDVLDQPPVVNPLRPAVNDLGEGLDPFVQAERAGVPLALDGPRPALGTGSAPIAQGGPQAAATQALGAGPETLALPAGARAMGMGPVALEGAEATPRIEALKKALGGKADLGVVKGTKGAGGKFLSKAVVDDAEQLRSMLNDPETRAQTMAMLLRLVQ